MRLTLRDDYKTIADLRADIEYQVYSFRRCGGLVCKTAEEAIASFSDRDEEVKEEVVYDKDVTIDDQEDYPDHTARVRVKAYYTDPGEDEYVYVVDVEEL